MIRDPTTANEDGIPTCFGDCFEAAEGCKRCPNEIKSRCENETELEGTRDPDVLDPITNRPDCFGKHYSEHSRKCNKQCDYAIQCASKYKYNRTSLPVLNNKPTSVRDPYNKVNYSSTVKETIVTPSGRPYISEEKAIEIYKRRLHPNPIVSGQFDGEEWYERLLKEFVLGTLKHAVTVMGNLLVDMLSKIRWAPKE